jgi:predicted MFS family arabinose efflux permease
MSDLAQYGLSRTTSPMNMMTPLLTLLFAVAVGIIVLPLYAAQPLIGPISTSFGVSPAAMGLTATMPMVGYAAGLLLLVPLTDLLEIRRLILTTLLVGAVALAAAALAPSTPVFLLAAFAFGASASAIQMLVPAAASMVPEAQRGRVIGNVMSGLMMGILLSRPLASVAAVVFGWRGSYVLDAVANAGALIVLHRALPRRTPTLQIQNYAALIASLWMLLVNEPVLRRRATYQAVCMGAFGIFWTAVALRLALPPFELGQNGIALFTLAGVGGVIVAPIAGWAGDRGWNASATRLAHATIVVASILAGMAGAPWLGFEPTARPAFSLALLAISAVVLDIGVIGDQTLGRRAVNLVNPAARGRVNGLYTGIFFLGGSIGSGFAGIASTPSGWTFVCLIAAGFGVTALILAVREH